MATIPSDAARYGLKIGARAGPRAGGSAGRGAHHGGGPDFARDLAEEIFGGGVSGGWRRWCREGGGRRGGDGLCGSRLEPVGLGLAGCKGPETKSHRLKPVPRGSALDVEQV